jgi:hypothetical protein
MNAPPPIQTAFHEVSDVLYRALGGGLESVVPSGKVAYLSRPDKECDSHASEVAGLLAPKYVHASSPGSPRGYESYCVYQFG